MAMSTKTKKETIISTTSLKKKKRYSHLRIKYTLEKIAKCFCKIILNL